MQLWKASEKALELFFNVESTNSKSTSDSRTYVQSSKLFTKQAWLMSIEYPESGFSGACWKIGLRNAEQTGFLFHSIAAQIIHFQCQTRLHRTRYQLNVRLVIKASFVPDPGQACSDISADGLYVA